MSTVQRRIGKYELQERLGRGGMAEVWKALDTRLQRHVAIKLLHADLQHDPDFMKRFEREARIIASLRHPNIVQIHDFQVLPFEPADPQGGKSGGLPGRASGVAGSHFQVSHPTESENSVAYMVMDYIEGPTLEDYIKHTSHVGKFPSAAEIVHLFASISAAVDYAHRHGMIHRDIKPANILLDQRQTTQNPIGEPILTDFGIAKLMGGTSGTLSGLWQGTPLCISPEQVRGYPGNERSDIYALGVILYEMCTGALPFQGTSPAEIMTQHLNTMPIPPNQMNPYIPPALQMVILRSLAKNPEERFPSASSMTAALAEALQVPIPENIAILSGGQVGPAYPTDIAFNTTPLSSAGSRPVDLTPPLGNTPAFTSQNTLMASTPAMPVLTPSVHSLGGGTASSPPTPDAGRVQGPPLHPAPPFTVSPGAASPAPQRRRRSLILTLLLLLVLLSTGLGAFFLIPRGGTGATNSIAGYAFFVSSGQIIGTNSQGDSDQLQINLQNISPPPVGKSYYAWLLSDRLCDINSNSYSPAVVCALRTQKIVNPPIAPPIYIGQLMVHNGSVQFAYAGDAKHTNLISFMSRLVITEETTSANPSPPSSSDTSTWRFYGELPQLGTSHGLNHFSALHGLRGLLFEGSDLKAHGIHGGLDIVLLRNTQKILEWAKSARDSWAPNAPDINLIHRQVVRILHYLDGNTFFSHEVPASLDVADPSDYRFSYSPLVTYQPAGSPGPTNSYGGRILNHLCYIILAPDTSVQLRNQAISTYADVNDLASWFRAVHDEAMQLVTLSDAQLRQPAVLPVLNTMLLQANRAFVGQVDPNTDNVKPGVVDIHYAIQNLATFAIRPYSANEEANPLRLDVPAKTSSYTCIGN